MVSDISSVLASTYVACTLIGDAAIACTVIKDTFECACIEEIGTGDGELGMAGSKAVCRSDRHDSVQTGTYV